MQDGWTLPPNTHITTHTHTAAAAHLSAVTRRSTSGFSAPGCRRAFEYSVWVYGWSSNGSSVFARRDEPVVRRACERARARAAHGGAVGDAHRSGPLTGTHRLGRQPPFPPRLRPPGPPGPAPAARRSCGARSGWQASRASRRKSQGG